MDALFLSRIQFAITSMFHYIYPPLSIGLGLMLVLMEGIYIKTKNPLYKTMTKFWVRIFALTFALGVATGLVQVFGFGTNWARYSRFVGDVFGSALGAEGIFAFFLEAGFLGIVLFGWEKVSARIHYLATILVAMGAHFSAFWIVIANAWMQTPTAYRIEGTGEQARAVVTDFWGMLFNPSAVDRIVHVILGCWLAGIFLVISVSAYYMLKKKHLPFAEPCMKMGLVAGMITLVLQLISADSTAKGVAQNQPSKFAALEGVYKTAPSTPITVIGWVDTEKKEVRGIQIPGVLSFLTYGNTTTPVPGLDQIPLDEQPPIQLTFQAYHIMVWMWGALFSVTLAGLVLWKRKRLVRSPWVLRALVLSVVFPQIANQVGWITAEVGRQPWLVYGVLKTSQGLSKTIHANQVVASIVMFIVIYILLFSLFIFLLDRKIKHGPEEEEDDLIYQNPYVALKGKKR